VGWIHYKNASVFLREFWAIFLGCSGLPEIKISSSRYAENLSSTVTVLPLYSESPWLSESESMIQTNCRPGHQTANYFRGDPTQTVCTYQTLATKKKVIPRSHALDSSAKKSCSSFPFRGDFVVFCTSWFVFALCLYLHARWEYFGACGVEILSHGWKWVLVVDKIGELKKLEHLVLVNGKYCLCTTYCRTLQRQER